MNKHILISFFVFATIMIIGCNENSKITGSAVSLAENNLMEEGNVKEEIDVNDQEISKEKNLQSEAEVQENDNEKERLEIIDKKREVLKLMETRSFDKVKISILLNEINDVDMINAWNKLQRCVGCYEFGSLKEDFIRITRDSIEQDLSSV